MDRLGGDKFLAGWERDQPPMPPIRTIEPS
jgi:hypothetical protein